jgi:DNA-binding SARP family transcriptional activator/tetratricopeptide (TPR) repeat protein/ABC-type transporter Mla MlaB component
MPPRFFLRCLGSPELRGPGGEPVRFRTRKHLALLTFLAVERREPQRRDRLADLLWPEASHAEGRHSLATALSVIRGKLGPRTFETSRESVRFVAPELEVDVERLARGEVLGDETTPQLEVAGFLEGFEVSRAPEFMLWRDLMRARWFPQIRDALVLLMDRCRRTGDFTRIDSHADRLLAIDELSEEAIRAKMEACAFAGDRITAIRLFQSWRQRLSEELDAKPSALVEGMALRLRQRGYEPPGTAHIPTVPTDQWRNRAFIGRAPQYLVLYERWEETNTGAGRHCLVLGESGIGKTTIVERLATAAGLEGAVSSRVQCYEVEREIPYAAIGTVVRGLLDRPGATGTPPEWLAELAHAVPAVTTRFPNLPPARESAGEMARLRLTEAAHELVTAVADEQPVILVVDDVHLADDASVAVLHLLMRRTQEQRIMIVMTARQSELGNSPHAGRLLEHKVALGLEPVELPPLTEEEMTEVVSALAVASATEVPPAVRQALLRASAGVPMIVELLFDDWRTHGEECLALSVGAMTVDALGHDQHQEMYQRVFERALRGLSEPARAVLNLAAILGERLNDLTMYELVDLSLAQTLAGMAELAERRIIRDGGREVEFRNELFRGYTYLNVPSPLRRALHGLIADRLLAAEAKGNRVPGLTLAWHCFRAGRPVEAEPHLLRGAREALKRGGTFEVELALTSAMRGLTPDTRDEAELLLAEALQDQGRWSESLDVLAQGRGGGLQNGHRRRSLALAARSATTRSVNEARECLADLRGFLTEAGDVSTKAHVIESLRYLVFYLRDMEEGEAAYRETSALIRQATELGDRLLLRAAHAALVWLTSRGLEFDEAIRELEVLGVECREGEVFDSKVARLHHLHGCLLTTKGRYAQALDQYMVAFSMARKHGNTTRERIAADNISMCYGRLGNYQAQLKWARKALARLSISPDPWEQTIIASRIAWALAMLGENRQALSEFERLATESDSSGRMWVEQAGGLMRADIYLLADSETKAVTIASEAFADTDWRPLSDAYAGLVARWMARTATQSEYTKYATDYLATCVRGLHRFDLIDQAEIVLARQWLRQQLRETWPEEPRILLDLLAALPAPVSDQLRRLKLL